MSAIDTAVPARWTLRRLAAGLAQSLGVWLVLVAVNAVLPGGRWPWRFGLSWYAIGLGILVIGAAGSLAVALWHWRRRRPDAATGAYIGSVTWPVAILAVSLLWAG